MIVTKNCLKAIAELHKGKSYDQVTKAELYEALKWARHAAGATLALEHKEAPEPCAI